MQIEIAICPNNNELHIYAKNASGEFVVEHRLTEVLQSCPFLSLFN